MKPRWWSRTVSLSAIVLMASCADELPTNHHEFRSEFEARLPIYYELRSFHIGVYRRVGSGDTAAFQAPVKAVIRARENLYLTQAWFGDTAIVSIATLQDLTHDLVGTVVLRRNQGWKSWQTKLDVDLRVLPPAIPADSIAASRLLIRGSGEEQRWSSERQFAIEREQRLRWERIRSLISTAITGQLTVEGQSGLYEFIIRFHAYDPRDESIKGEIRFPTLSGAAKEFHGRVEGYNIAVQESSWLIRPPDTTGILFGNRYNLHLSRAGQIESGNWQHPRLRGSLQFR